MNVFSCVYIFLLLILSRNVLGKNPSTAGRFCDGLDEAKIKLNNGYLHPKNCSQSKVAVGTTCGIICKKGYGWKDFSYAENQCSVTGSTSNGWTVHKSTFYQVKCNPLPKCPVLDSFDKKNWWPPSCNSMKLSSGTSCKTQYCAPEQIGVKNKVCQQNGTWTPLGGAYCKKGSLYIRLECPKSFTVSMDPEKATADIRGRLPLPDTKYPESEFRISSDKNRNITALPEYRSWMYYTVLDPHNGVQRKCHFQVDVEDTERPMVLRCPEELHFTVAEGLKLEIKYDFRKEVKIVDVSDSSYMHGQHGGNSTTFHGSKVDPGNWTITYYLRDSNRLESSCAVKIRVKSKPCQMHPRSNGAVISKHNNKYYASCPNGTSSFCSAIFFWPGLDFSRCSSFGVSFGGMTCDKMILEPFPTCVNDSLLPDAINGSCPRGSVKSRLLPNKCYKCEKSMYYNATTKKCHLCPDNTTNYELGSLSCLPCPKHQMTKLRAAPRFCEDICNPGSWLDSSNQTCTKCARGFYAASGARSCSKCPSGLTTLQEESTSSSECVVGDVINQDSGSTRISKHNTTVRSTSMFLVRINTKPLNQINQQLAFQFTSTYLSDCAKGYVRLYTVVNTIEFGLSERLCGNALKNPQFVRVMKNRPAYVQFYFTDINAAELAFRFGVAECALGHVFDFGSLSCQPCPVNTHRSQHNARVCQPCKPGTAAPVPGSFRCQEKCPRGSYRIGTHCENCPIGSYQDELEQRVCKKCPNATTTSNSQSKNITKCVVSCGLGQYKSGNSCLPCQPDTYQNKPVHADRMCYFCPAGKTTVGSGATSCVDKCNYEGEYYSQTEGKCKKCQIGTYKVASQYQVDACAACPVNHTTNRLGAASISECIDTYDNCSPNPCQFPGWCEDTGTSFKCHCPYLFTGKLCENKMHTCESNPCQNNGTCYNVNVWSKWYYCHCPPEFTGKNCETVYHACSDNPCYYGNCTVVNKDFKCECPPWRSGKRCERGLVKPCRYYPCRNGATCTNGIDQHAVPPYTCNCAPDYTGTNCETRIDNCVNNTCKKPGTSRCLDRVNSYKCHCNPYYRKPDCSEPYGCARGEYLKSKNFCEKCPKGQYMSVRNEYDRCFLCSTNQDTYKEGSKSYNDCYDVNKITKLDVTLKITNKVWSDKLLDKTTSEYQSLASEWEVSIAYLYKNESNFKAVDVNSFSKGSVICDFTVYFLNGVQDPKGQLHRGIQKGQLKGFNVNASTIYTAKDDKKTVVEKKSYTLTIVLVVVAVLLVAAVISGCFLYKKHKESVVGTKFDTVVGGDTASMDIPLTNK